MRDAGGRFIKGHPASSPGRPRRPDPWTIATRGAEASGEDLEGRLYAVIKKLLDLAIGGDVQAARLVINTLLDVDGPALKVEGRMTLEDLIVASITPDERAAWAKPMQPQ